MAAPSITNISDNRAGFTNSNIPKFEKFEITFQINNSFATNFQLPYDTNPPAGVPPGEGITVNAQFTPDNWATTYTQPAFYYQNFVEDTSQPFNIPVKNGQNWIYPDGSYVWKVRFSPPKAGNWEYKLTAQDSGGLATSQTSSFTAVESNNHGFIKVSSNDPRYFEYGDGTYFPALGYNMNYDQIAWDNPILDNTANFSKMGQNGIQVIRNWLSQWGIWSSNDATWASMKYGPDDQGLSVNTNYSGSDVTMMVQKYWQPCMALGAWKQGPALKQNTNYRIFIRYLMPFPITNGSALDKTKPAGLVAKISDWLDPPTSNPSNNCASVGSGTDVMPVISSSPRDTSNNSVWSISQASFNSNVVSQISPDFLRRFYLSMENVDNVSVPTQANEVAYIDRVEIREDAIGCASASGPGNQFDLTNGKCGVNIISQPSVAYHEYFDQKYSYSFDKVLEMAKQNNVYLKLVVMEKNEFIQNHIDYNGNPTSNSSNDYFYGNWGAMTKIYWYQQAWWRYLQARWGYSPNIHSWELLNEGDPFSGLHYSLADNFAKYMHQFKPNQHLVTTSFWHSFPIDEFWKNSSFPNLDYADVHQYIPKSTSVDLRIDQGSVGSVHLYDSNNSQYFDSALSTQIISNAIGAKQVHGVGKPVMRGETGFINSTNTDSWDPDLQKDTKGIWLHNYIWGGINPGGLIESYWYENVHVYTNSFDNRSKYKDYYDFIKNIPLSNGKYADIQAAVSNSSLIRAWGQKDVLNKRAHLWISNSKHTWCAVVGGISGCPNRWTSSDRLSGTVTITGFPTNISSLPVEWWYFDTNAVLSKQPATTIPVSNGQIVLNLDLLPGTVADAGVKIGDYTSVSGPSPTVSPSCISDVNHDHTINQSDLLLILQNFGSNISTYDINQDGKVNTEDAVYILKNWGRTC